MAAWKRCWVADGKFVYDEASVGSPIIADTMSSAFTSEQCEGHARLIAAAPAHEAVARELDALRLVIESSVRNTAPEHNARVLDLIKANRAAITKASGVA